jgi:glycosyltransferase involved in cell wall biosynthesis
MLYVAPFKDYSGYASVSRDYALALAKSDVDIVTRSLRYDGGSHSTAKLDELEGKTLEGVEIVIQQTTPNEMEPTAGKFNVGVFCWETDKIPDIWVQHLNRMDLVLVPCSVNLDAVRKSGVIVPVEKVHYATDVEKYKKGAKPYILPGMDTHFKFLSIFQFSKKKAFDALLKAYLTEFNADDDVCLMVKTYFGPKDTQEHFNKIAGLIQAMKELLRLKSYPKIHLIHGLMSHEDIDRLYATGDCYVLPSRGEGWGVPHLDALGHGLQAIATKGTGPEEFINPACGWLVESHDSPVLDMPHPFDFLYTGKENWKEPHVGHLKSCMRESYGLWSARETSKVWKLTCESAATRVNDFSHEKIGPELRDVILKYYNMWSEANVR